MLEGVNADRCYQRREDDSFAQEMSSSREHSIGIRNVLRFSNYPVGHVK